MAHGKKENTDAYFVKLLGVKEKQPVFEISHKNDAGEYVKEEASFIEGKFDSIEKSTYEWEGKPRDIFKLHLSDGVDKYILNFSYTAMSRNLLNCLAGAKVLDTIRIEVRGYNKEGVNKNAIKVLNNGEKMKWAMAYDDTKEMVKIYTKEDGSYLSSDYDKLDNWFMDQFDSINKKKKVVEVNKTVEKEDLDGVPF